MAIDITKLIQDYRQAVSGETDNSLRSCEILYELQQTLVREHGNEQSRGYKKAMNLFRKETGVSKQQFGKDAAVGKVLTVSTLIPSNELRTLSKNQIYKKHCLAPKDTAPKPKKPSEVEMLRKRVAELEEQISQIEATHRRQVAKFLAKYESLLERA
jgi:hypothetical protein